jgi:hypothetical protein
MRAMLDPKEVHMTILEMRWAVNGLSDPLILFYK